MWNKETITEHLRKGIVDIKFTKKDGSLRDMRCTLNEKFLPQIEKTEDTKKENANVLAVWDIDNSGWRSFTINNIVFVGELND